MKWFFLYIGVLIFMACGSTKTGGVQAPALEGEYQIVQVGSETLNDPEFTIIFDLEEQSAYGYVGCNRFSSGFTQDGGMLHFNRSISTKMYCEGKMEIEDQVLRSLEEVTGVRHDNGNLVLHSSDNKGLITIKK